MAKKLIKVENRSIPILYALVILPLLIAILAQFNIIDLTAFQTSVLTILSALFVASEVGVMGMLRQKKLSKDPLRIFGALVAVVAIIAASVSLFGLQIALLQNISGIINALVIIYVVIEGFR